MFVFVHFLAASLILTQAETDLSMKDVEALASRSSYSELMDKAHQVLPSKRNEAWQGYIESAFSQLANMGLKSQKYFEYAKMYPFTLKNKEVLSRFSDFAEQLLSACKERFSENCVADVAGLVSEIQDTKALNEIGTTLYRAGYPSSAVLYFNHSAKIEPMPACGDPSLKLALAKVFNKLKPGNPRLEAASEVSFKHCFAQLEKDFQSWIATEGDNFRQNTCGALVKKGSLKGVPKKKCQRLVKR